MKPLSILQVALLCASFASGSAAALAQDAVGRFVTTGGSVIVKRKPTPDTFDVSVTRDTGHCSGALSGPGRAYLSSIVTLSEADPASRTTCTVDLLYAPDFASLDVKESAACLVWHGAGCNFEGSYRRRR